MLLLPILLAFMLSSTFLLAHSLPILGLKIFAHFLGSADVDNCVYACQHHLTTGLNSINKLGLLALKRRLRLRTSTLANLPHCYSSNTIQLKSPISPFILSVLGDCVYVRLNYEITCHHHHCILSCHSI